MAVSIIWEFDAPEDNDDKINESIRNHELCQELRKLGFEFSFLRDLTEEQVEQVKELVAVTFTEKEPLTNHKGIEIEDFRTFSDTLVDYELSQNRSLSCACLDQEGNVIAFTLGNDYLDPLAEPEISQKLGMIFQFIEKVETMCPAAQFQFGQAYHYFLGGTAESHENSGIGFIMRKLSLVIAGNRGFQKVLVECFNGATQHLWVNKLGGREIGMMVSSEYVHIDEQGNATRPFADFPVDISTTFFKDRERKLSISHRVVLVVIDSIVS